VEVWIVTEQPVRKDRLFWFPEARKLKWITFDDARNMQFEVAIATFWRTVYELKRVSAKTYAYFVQSIESRFYPEAEAPLRKLAEATYLLPPKIITEAKWIKEYLEERYYRSSFLVRNGIRKQIFAPHGQKYAEPEPGKLRLLIEGHVDVPFKNVRRTIEIARRSNADEIWLLTATPIARYPGVHKVFSQVPVFDTAKIYRSCDAILKLSYVEGMSMPPLEMFHCGGTAITYRVTGDDEYIRHGRNALVADPGNEQQVIKHINALKSDPDLLRSLKLGAIRTAEKWPDWSKSSLQFQRAVSKITSKRVPCEELRMMSDFMFDFYVIAKNYRQMTRSTIAGASLNHVLTRIPLVPVVLDRLPRRCRSSIIEWANTLRHHVGRSHPS
jgi:glycosyltransferase involved in cell wall biosynthesis